ncbi:Peptidase C39-like domain-containing protein OS=Cellulomonas persica OX=76861 GN=CPE01_12780 PE=4 SV=1 [Cellulomonas persica]|uniref:Peptidase C39-like domain-containing protein n=2 Tax=Cellulomonas persica TaxID=76861 RepID=A0A510UXL4_9CELL|nr:hypothetical protein CPE01_12780 [Cellulomonas persica]
MSSIRMRALMVSVLVAGGLAGTSSATAAEADVVQCATVDGLKFCTEVGFTKESTTAIRARVHRTMASANTAFAAGPLDTGDLTPAEQLAQLAGLTPEQLKARQDAQLAEARDAVGRMKLVDYVDSGKPIPAGFFAKYPQLHVKEGSAQARALRAGTSMRFAAASGNSTRLAVSSDPSKDYEYIMPNVARDQKTSYWCGPATMEMMDLGDGGSLRTQAKWAELLGTTTDGTGIGAMKDGMNAYTTWDNTAGKYVTVDLSDRTASWFFSAHRTRVGFTKSPVVEHVQLLMKYFSYLNYNHGGHYQVGRGYSSTTGNVIGIIDPYDERDYRSGGAASGGYHVIPLDKMWGATLANVNQNFSY